MKSKINKYFFQEFLRYFAIVLFALVSIVWIAQTVNFLDLVVDDGHAFGVFFSYSILNIPKIITKLLPFSFLTALTLTILKLEKDSELIVLWTSGLNKIKIVNLIFYISVLATFFQLLLATTIVPYSLNESRSILKESNLHFLPSLIKEKNFSDSLSGVTFFVEKKSPDGSINNIFIRDSNEIIKGDSEQLASTIFAKKGVFKHEKNTKHIILYDGSIQKEKRNGDINFIKFDKIILNLGNLHTKTITKPKLQETSSIKILQCLFIDYKIPHFTIPFKNYKIDLFNKDKIDLEDHNCKKENKTLTIEANRRFGMPFYIPILALIGSFLLSSRKENKISNFNKFIFFFIGVSVLIFAEISVRYSWGILYTYLYYSIPILLVPLIYIILLKHLNMKT